MSRKRQEDAAHAAPADLAQDPVGPQALSRRELRLVAGLAQGGEGGGRFEEVPQLALESQEGLHRAPQLAILTAGLMQVIAPFRGRQLQSFEQMALDLWPVNFHRQSSPPDSDRVTAGRCASAA